MNADTASLPRPRRFGLTVKAVAALSLMLLAANLLLGGLLMHHSQQAMKEQINKRMLETASTAASMLDGDVLARLKAEDEPTPPYQAVLNRLRHFQDNVDLRYIYCIRDMGNGSFTFTVDPTVLDPGAFGEGIVATDALRAAASGSPAVDATAYRDRWGRFYSAYCPVMTSQGKVGGIVAVDFDAAWYEEQIAMQARDVVVSCLASLLAGSLAVLLATMRLRRRFSALSADVAGLSRGIDALMEELSLPGSPPPAAPAKACAGDEIGLLDGRVQTMRERVQSYRRHAQSQAFSMIAALSADYRSLYYANLAKDSAVCYRGDPALYGRRAGETFAFSQAVREYAQKRVAEPYREGFLKLFEPESIQKASERVPVISYRYLGMGESGRECYELVRIASTGPGEIGISFSDVDAETRRAMEQSRRLRASLMDAAEEASRAKTAFLSSMSHEFRTPMNAIIGIGGIALADPGISEATRGRLERMSGAARHLLGLVDDILDVSRLESGGLTLAHEAFSLAGLVGQVSSMAESQCREAGLAYRREIRGALPESAVGDGPKLEKVLSSILGNAVKFTPSGSVSFEVDAEAALRGRPAVRFAVRDTGIGMAQDFLPKVFQPFSQEDGSSTSKYASAGLGLAIAKRIVDLMHGTIVVESEKGRGSVFTVTVPVELAAPGTCAASGTAACGQDAPDQAGQDAPDQAGQAVPDQAGQDAPDQAGQAVPDQAGQAVPDQAGQAVPVQAATDQAALDLAELRGRRILLAEDNEINVEIMQTILEGWGMAVDTAGNGRVCFEKFASAPAGHYDAILMDMRMPEMDGLEATGALRALPRDDARTIPVVGLSANAFCEDEAKSLQAGLDAHLGKPVEPEKLLRTLASLIAERRNGS